MSIVRLARAAVGTTNPRKFSPALIIGLGPTGEQALEMLSAELALDGAGEQQHLRLVLLTTRGSPSGALVGTPAGISFTRRFDLGSLEPVAIRVGQSINARAALLTRFLQPTLYDSLSSYFRGAQNDLRGGLSGDQDTRIVVLGGLGEPEIGLLGNLMLLLFQTGGGRGLSKRVVLLAADAAEPELDATEEAAVLRELSRLTFLGPHVLPQQASQSESAAINALIDYLFLVQNAGGLQRAEESVSSLAFEQGVGQAMAELTYLMLHPSGGDIWVGLQNDHTLTGNLRVQTHSAYVYGAGLATLFVPVTQLQAYIAARLAIAAVFGEQKNKPEGLLGRHYPPISYAVAGSSLVRSWLQDEPLAHRLLSGLLEANGPDAFHNLPPVGVDQAGFVALLPAQVAHGMITLLNDGRPDTLQRAEAGLTELRRYLEKWIGWCQTAAGVHPSDAHRNLLYILDQWQIQIGDLYQQLGRWRSALGATDSSPTPGLSGSMPPVSSLSSGRLSPLPPLGATQAAPPTLPTFDTLPPLIGGSSWTPHAARMGPVVSQFPLFELLQRQLKKTESDLGSITGGGVRRPLTADSAAGRYDGLGEAEKYYNDTIRPELVQFLDEPSQAYQDVAKRLWWWIKLTRNAPPELLLICLPVDVELPAGALLPPDSAVFSPTDIEQLATTLLDIAAVQTQKTAENLANWMLGRLQKPENHRFLRRAEPVFLNFDGELARSQHVGTLGIRPYLIGPSGAAIGTVAGHVFPAVAATAVQHISDGELTRVSTLLLQTNIPVNTIQLTKRTQQTYGQSAGYYLYEQERLAATYESQSRAATPFPPDFVVALTQPELVRLFCHGVFAGLIAVRKPNPLGYEEAWTVASHPATAQSLGVVLPWESDRNAVTAAPPIEAPPLDVWGNREGSHEEWLRLAGYSVDREWQSLWEAMKAFTLELPYGQSLATQPIHPFHPENRATFLARLREAITALRESVDGEAAMSRRAAVLRARLQLWRVRAGNDALARAFFTVLESELLRPGRL